MVDLAARLPSSMTRVIAALPVIRSAKPSEPLAWALMRLSSPASASILSAFLMETSSRSGLTGFTTKSTAPARIAEIAASIEPWAVCTMAGGFFGSVRMAPSTAMPSVPGMTRSSRTRQMSLLASALSAASALSPLSAVATL